jgi:prevent-host-death family protein
MERIGVRDLNQQTSYYLDRVRAGETIEITKHGDVIARLVPAQRGGRVLDRLIAEGRVRPARGSLLDLLPLPDREFDGVNVAEGLAAMRDEEQY